MSERRQQILQTAIEIIADEGYASLTMRALARASGMKLGALQYHFRTSEDMLRALVGHIADAYRASFTQLRLAHHAAPGIREIVVFILEDEAGTALLGDQLWPQLWAMQQVEPLVSDLVDDIYENYIATLEHDLKAAGNPTPRAEALCLMSLLEGSTIFLGSGRRWHDDAGAVRDTLLAFIDYRYGAIA